MLNNLHLQLQKHVNKKCLSNGTMEKSVEIGKWSESFQTETGKWWASEHRNKRCLVSINQAKNDRNFLN